MQTFDATVDFETTELNDELRRALDSCPNYKPGMQVTAIVRCDSETGELYIGDEADAALAELSMDDWCVVEMTVTDLADALRAKL